MIDLTEGLTDFPPVESIALDDNNQVAFAGWSWTPAQTTRVAVWKDGAITQDFQGAADTETKSYSPAAVNAAGTLAGSMYSYDEEDYGERLFLATNSAVEEYPLPTIYNRTYPPGEPVEEAISPSGFNVKGFSQLGAIFGEFSFSVFGSNYGYFVGSPGSPYVSHEFDGASSQFQAMALSPAGVAAGWGSQDGNSGAFVRSSSGALTYLGRLSHGGTTLPLNPFAVNDQKQVVGQTTYGFADGPLGFLYTPASGGSPGGAQDINDLLPAKYRQQLRYATPYLITNADVTTGKPTIVFRAESLEGDSEGDWVQRDFQLSWLNATTTAVDEVAVALQDRTVPDLAQTIATAPDGKGSIVAIQASKPFLKHDFKFRAQDIRLGFDLPLEDRHPGADQPDHIKPEWWTKVARTNGTIIDPTTGSPYNSTINKNIRLIFANDHVAKSYKIVVPSDSSSLIEAVNDAGGDLKQETTLRITGKNPSTPVNAAKARVLITNQLGTQTVCRLEVDVLPVRKITLGIYFVQDTRQGSATNIPSAYQNTTEIVKALNEIFRQSCVEFELADSGVKEVPYDIDGNGKLDLPPVIGSPLSSQSERRKIFNIDGTFPLSQTLTLLIVRDIGDPKNIGVTPQTQPVTKPMRSVVETAYFEGLASDSLPMFYTTCAHEIGHALGLSTRDSRSGGNHDRGIFPSQYYNLDGSRVSDPANLAGRMDGALMRSDSGLWRWMRHEDWIEANKNAEKFLLP